MQNHTSHRKAEGSRSRRKRSMLSHICALCDKFTANLWFQFCKPMGKVTAVFNHILASLATLWLKVQDCQTMSGRSQRCCATACRRGPRPTRSHTGCRVRIGVWSDPVRSDGGQQGPMRGGKPTWRTHDRLMDTPQTAWGKSRHFIRNGRVHDPC